jgi:hypothetical protein
MKPSLIPSTEMLPGFSGTMVVTGGTSYALAAHDTLGRAIAGLAVAVPGLTIFTTPPTRVRWG